MSTNVCQHGQLSRSCERCDDAAEIARLREGLAALTEAPLCPLSEYHAMRERAELAERERDEAMRNAEILRQSVLVLEDRVVEVKRERDEALAGVDRPKESFLLPPSAPHRGGLPCLSGGEEKQLDTAQRDDLLRATEMTRRHIEGLTKLEHERGLRTDFGRLKEDA